MIIIRNGEEHMQNRLDTVNRVGVVILSRLSSKRLPGKALLQINQKPILQYIIERLQNFIDKDSIILATSTESSDNKICEFAKVNGINFYRGSLENVAERFMEASISRGFDYAIRITGDSIFIDGNIYKTMINKVRLVDYDMISNRKHQTYPIGQTFEVINMESYKNYYKKFSSPEDFEHVTHYLYNYEKKDKINIYHHINPDGVFRNVSLAIDTINDFKMAKKVINELDNKLSNVEYKKIYKLYESLL